MTEDLKKEPERNWKEDFVQLLHLFAAAIKDVGVLKINKHTLIRIDLEKIKIYRLDMPDHISFALDEGEGEKENGSQHQNGPGSQ